jgi:Protein kinase domain
MSFASDLPPDTVGRLLVERGMISRAQLEWALQVQGQPPYPRLGEVVVEQGWVPRPDLEAALREARDASGVGPAAHASNAATVAPAGATGSTVFPSTVADLAAARADPRKRFDRYVILDSLGEGAFGAVYRALDEKLEREVALKVLKRPSPKARERFAREMKALARLRHPGIVPVFDSGEVRETPYMVLELVPGRSLEDLLERDQTGRLDAREATRITRDVARAVHFAHQQGVLHRDLKPANVLLCSDGQARVLDFGLAKLKDVEGQRLTLSGTATGTPGYMPPEQTTNEAGSVDERSDVYALGATLYHLVCGQPPFVGASFPETLLKILREPPVPPGKIVRGLPAGLEAVIMKCLEKEPGARYDSAEAVAAALDDVLAGRTRARRRAEGGSTPGGTARLVLPALAAAAILVAAAVLLVGPGTDRGPTAGPAADRAAPTAEPEPDVSSPAPAVTQVPVRVALESPRRFSSAGVSAWRYEPRGDGTFRAAATGRRLVLTGDVRADVLLLAPGRYRVEVVVEGRAAFWVPLRVPATPDEVALRVSLPPADVPGFRWVSAFDERGRDASFYLSDPIPCAEWLAFVHDDVGAFLGLDQYPRAVEVLERFVAKRQAGTELSADEEATLRQAMGFAQRTRRELHLRLPTHPTQRIEYPSLGQEDPAPYLELVLVDGATRLQPIVERLGVEVSLVDLAPLPIAGLRYGTCRDLLHEPFAGPRLRAVREHLRRGWRLELPTRDQVALAATGDGLFAFVDADALPSARADYYRRADRFDAFVVRDDDSSPYGLAGFAWGAPREHTRDEPLRPGDPDSPRAFPVATWAEDGLAFPLLQDELPRHDAGVRLVIERTE